MAIHTMLANGINRLCNGAIGVCSRNPQYVFMCAYHTRVYCLSCLETQRTCCPDKMVRTVVQACASCKSITLKEEMAVFAGKYFCENCLPDQGETNFYLLRMGHREISEVIKKLVEKCIYCLGPKSQICLEIICQNAIFCPGCERLDHLGHKSNKVSALCINNRFLNSSNNGERRLRDLIELRGCLVSERFHCLKVGLIHFANSMAGFLSKLQGFIRDSQVSWDKQLDQCIQDHFLLKKTSLEAARKTFAECLAKVNIGKPYKPEAFKGIMEMLSAYAANRSCSFYFLKMKQEILKLLGRVQRQLYREKIANTPVQFQVYMKRSLKWALTKQPDREIQLSLWQLSPHIEASRLFIYKDQPLNSIHEEGLNILRQLPQHIQEILTEYHFPSYPQSLKSINLYFGQYKNKIQNLNVLVLPRSLTVLRCLFSRLNRPEIDLANLHNLKYLVVYGFSPQQTRRYVSFAITRNLRMLCLLNGTHRTSPPRWLDIENASGVVHLYPELQRHCLEYRQKMCQIQVLEKTRLKKSPEFIRSTVIWFASNSRGLELEAAEDLEY